MAVRWVCAECQALWAPGAPCCPACRSLNHVEEDGVEKIVNPGGPSGHPPADRLGGAEPDAAPVPEPEAPEVPETPEPEPAAEAEAAKPPAKPRISPKPAPKDS